MSETATPRRVRAPDAQDPQLARTLRSTPEWEYLRRQIYKRAIRFTDHLVFDFREMLNQAQNADLAGRLMWQLVKPFAPSVLIAPGFGSMPLAYMTAAAALRDGVALEILVVRDARKDHNRRKWVEGARQPTGSRAVVIDDFMKNGSVLGLVHQALEADRHALDIRGVVVFFDMWEPLGSRQIVTSSYPVVSLFKRHDIGLSRDAYDAVPPLFKGAHPRFLKERVWWRLDLNEKKGYPFKSSPVIADGAVFAADDHCRVWRHDARDGAIEWRYDSLADPRKGIVQLLQYADGSLVFGCYDGTVTRLDAADGSVIWRRRQDSSVHATPAVDLAHRRVFVNTEQWNEGSPCGHLQALDWATGRLLWTHAHRYWPPGSPFYDAASNAVIATCNDRSIVCVDADTGALRWSSRTQGLVRGRPCAANGSVYAATESGRLHCFDLAIGAQKWTVRYGQGARHHVLEVVDGALLVFDGKWHLTAFDAETGEIRWFSRLRSAGCWNPVPCGRYAVALSTEGHVAVLDRTRELKVWEDRVTGAYHQPPAIGEGLIAFASNDQGLKVFRIDPFYLEGVV